VTTASRTAQGAILTVEERKSQLDAQKPPAITHSLVIASDAGELLSFDLADVRSVRLLDTVKYSCPELNGSGQRIGYSRGL